jgi:hypothetical protein
MRDTLVHLIGIHVGVICDTIVLFRPSLKLSFTPQKF